MIRDEIGRVFGDDRALAEPPVAEHRHPLEHCSIGVDGRNELQQRQVARVKIACLRSGHESLRCAPRPKQQSESPKYWALTIVPAFRKRSTFSKSVCFRSSRSTIASIIHSCWLTRSRWVSKPPVVINETFAGTKNGSGFSFRARSSPSRATVSVRSRSNVRTPAFARCAAICAPIVPAPVPLRIASEKISPSLHYPTSDTPSGLWQQPDLPPPGEDLFGVEKQNRDSQQSQPDREKQQCRKQQHANRYPDERCTLPDDDRDDRKNDQHTYLLSRYEDLAPGSRP